MTSSGFELETFTENKCAKIYSGDVSKTSSVSIVRVDGRSWMISRRGFSTLNINLKAKFLGSG
jgi:hypothetical protein